MLPATYQLPAAIVLLIGGDRLVLLRLPAVPHRAGDVRVHPRCAGRQLGVRRQRHVADDGARRWSAGLIGAGVMFAAYFVGVALVGAALGAVVANLVFPVTGRDPHVLAVVFCSIARRRRRPRYLQRYFIIVGTGFGGAWTLIVGAMALRWRTGRRWPRRPPATCGWPIRWIRRRASGGCRLRGACWGCWAPPCSWGGPAARRAVSCGVRRKLNVVLRKLQDRRGTTSGNMRSI